MKRIISLLLALILVLTLNREPAIIEGSYSHHPAFAQSHDRLGALRVFVSVSAEEQLARIAQRDPEMLNMFRTRWIPLEKTYFEAYDIKDRAHMALVSQPWDRA